MKFINLNIGVICSSLIFIIIAIDFDGSIVEHKYPSNGRKRLFIFKIINALQTKQPVYYLTPLIISWI